MPTATLQHGGLAFPKTEPIAINCFSLFDKVLPNCALIDYSDGIDRGDLSTPYEAAQSEQIHDVLDEVHCTAGNRILDVGCGNGTLLEAARRRGAIGVGLTMSPEQVATCRRRGLDARCFNDKFLDGEWSHQFDAVVVNGTIEQFVQPSDADQGLSNEIYRKMFETFHRAIDPASPVRRLINTTIHFIRAPRPENMLINPWLHRTGSDRWHWAWLARSFGGYYPRLGQLESSAKGHFRLVKSVDGTDDYRRNTEEWLRRLRRALRTRLGLQVFAKVLPFAVRHPWRTIDFLTCLLATESWNWQFRGSNPPTRLLRQTWEYQP